MKMAIGNLSEDLLMEILCRLPVKSLLQFKSVCKNWYALIQNPDFIYLHHDRATSIAAAKNTHCLLVKRFLNGGEGGAALSFVPNETPVEDIDISSTGLDINHLKIWGHCNGIVCLTKLGDTTIVLCNPSMKEFRILPQPSYENDNLSNLGFGYDPSTDDYKVVRFFMMSSDGSVRDIDKKVQMYDLSTDSWRDVDAESPNQSGFDCNYYCCTSWNGDFFWYASRWDGGDPVIMAFSMSDEVFEEIPVPEVCLIEYYKKELFILNDSLAIVIYPKWWFAPEDFLLKTFDIWVMNEEDVEVSWAKKFTIERLQGLDCALGFRQNGEFLMQSSCGGQMMSYNVYSQERKEYEVHDLVREHRRPPRIQVLPYTESLVSVK